LARNSTHSLSLDSSFSLSRFSLALLKRIEHDAVQEPWAIGAEGEPVVVRRVGELREPVGREGGEGVAPVLPRQRRQLLRQCGGLRERPRRGDHGAGDPGARVEALRRRRFDQDLLGRPGPQRQGPLAQAHCGGHQGFAQAPRHGLRRRYLLPPPRHLHAHRGNRAGHESRD